MRQKLHAMAKSLFCPYLKRIVAAGGFVNVVAEALCPAERMAKRDPQLLRVPVEIGTAIIRGTRGFSHAAAGARRFDR